MIQATVNGKNTRTIDGEKIDGGPYEWDLLPLENGNYHIIRGDQSYRASVISIHHEEKTMVIRVNGNDYDISIRDKYDLLLSQMGITAQSSARINNFKAPMPGLIREIMTAEGAEVAKGDIVLILEAMKMENALKSPRDGRIKKVHIATGQAVEKGQVLLDFE
jgi:acetyl/propionyl-CoA carboxylase alpha subunit